MMRTDTNATSGADAARWAEAEALATGDTSGSGRSQGWRSPSRRLVLYMAAGGAVVVVVGVVLGVVFGGSFDHSSGSGVGVWREVVGGVLVIAGSGFAVVTLVRAHRTGVYGWSSPTRVLSLKQRRRAGRQLRGKAPVAEHELVVLRAGAEMILVQTRNSRPVLLGMALFGVGQALRSSSAVFAGLWVVMLVLYAGAAVMLPRDARRMQVFLDEHPAPTPVGGV